MLRFLRKLSRDEKGVSALEYAILAAVVVTAVVAGTAGMSDEIKSTFTNLTSVLKTANSSTKP